MRTHGLHATIGNVTPSRNVRLHAHARCQSGAGIATTVHRFGKDGVCLVIFRRHQHVIRLGNTNAKLIDRHRLNGLTVSGNYCHLESRDTQIEVAHGRAIDDTKTHGLTAAE